MVSFISEGVTRCGVGTSRSGSLLSNVDRPVFGHRHDAVSLAVVLLASSTSFDKRRTSVG